MCRYGLKGEAMEPEPIVSLEWGGEQWQVFLRQTSRETSPTGLALVFSAGSATGAHLRLSGR